jgi:glyoxylase-like metal-dependent hydrolase (beta-lactamase superfamily II)
MKIVPLKGSGVTHYLILRDDGVDLIDSGFLGAVGRVRKALAAEGRSLSEVRNLYLTHGHLDHTFNATRFRKLTGCKVFAPLADRAHLEGKHPYRGWSRGAGILEWLGRAAFFYKPVEVDHWFEPGESVGNYEVISLPGHTTGHCGFLHRDEQAFFTGDLFCNHLGKPAFPPRIFNDDQEEAKQSVRRAARVKAKAVYPNHTARQSATENLADLKGLAEKVTPPGQSHE